MKNEFTAVDREKAEAESEYRIGHTLYRVETHFNPTFKESLSDILKRLILRECEIISGETEQEIIKQAV